MLEPRSHKLDFNSFYSTPKSEEFILKPISVDVSGLKIGGEHPVRIMGVINLSPESFYKGSVIENKEQLEEAVRFMETSGADMIDVGGASTAPTNVYGTEKISIEKELDRISSFMPVVCDNTDLPVSVDTTSSVVAKTAIELGAKAVNDISGLRYDSKMAELITELDVPVIAMAKCDKPCQSVEASLASIRESLDIVSKYNIKRDSVILDPGIGFGKPPEVDYELIRRLQEFVSLGHPVLVGVSRKAFIGALLEESNPENRLLGTVAATAVAVVNGANIIRAHDVLEARIASRIGESLRGDDV